MDGFDGLIFIYQTDPVGYASKRVFLKFIDFELYELYYASYLCRGIGETLCSFEHVSCIYYGNVFAYRSGRTRDAKILSVW